MIKDGVNNGPNPGKPVVKSYGSSMDVKPPKNFRVRTERDFLAEEAYLEAEAKKLIPKEELEEKERLIRENLALKKRLQEQEEALKVAHSVPVKVGRDIPERRVPSEAKATENLVKEPIRSANPEVVEPSVEPELAKAVDEVIQDREENDAFRTMKKSKPKKSVIRILSRILVFPVAVVNGLFLTRMLTTSVLPAKYAYLLLAGIILMTLFYVFKAFRKKTHKAILVILDFLAIIISVVLGFATIKINEIFGFLDKNISNSKTYSVYNVIVNKNSNHEKLEDLRDQIIGTYEELVKDVSDEKFASTVSKKIPGSSLKYYSDIDELMNTIVNDPQKALIISSGSFESYTETVESYGGKVKIIATFEIEMEEKAIEATKHDLTNTPFAVYISGIDTRTDTMPTRSLSDVNIVAVINPKSKHVQLVSIPRDSYVQLHGTTGLKDKLTHAGSRGGVVLSQATLEDLYGIKIDRYVRVNFNFVKKLVDAIGGVTVDSDVNYTFTTKHEKCVIKPGKNDLDGKCAIGFSRERYAYKDGDRHRGRNQLQVIEKIFDKVTSGTTILSKYSQILESLNGTFDSNMAMDDITSLVRMQLDDMAKWKIEDYSITGKGQLTKTYSYPNQNLYVMHIDQKSLDTAKQKIKAVLAE